MEKLKSFKFNSFVSIIKAVLLAIIITLVGVVLLAVVLKFVDLSSSVINYVNNAVKILAIFIMVLYIKKREDNLLVKSILGGFLYALLIFVIFSILNGFLALNMGFIYDLLFAVIAAALASIISNIIRTRTT